MSAAKTKLRGDIRTDVVVIGAGIAGMTAAYLLKRAGREVVVLEKGTISSGVTGHSTGKVTSQHGLLYHSLVQTFGTKVARDYGEANQAALEHIAKTVKRERISCDWEQDDNYVYSEDPKNVERLKREAAAAKRLGLPASFETDTPLPFPVRGAVKFAKQGKFYPPDYLKGLAKTIRGGGSRIFEQTPALKVRDGKEVTVTTGHGTVTAEEAILATHVPFPFMTHGVYCALEYPKTSYLVAGRSDPDFRGMYISIDTPYHTIQTFGSAQKRLLVGGESHIPTFRLERQSRYGRIAKFAKERFGMEKVEHRWMAFDYFGYDGLPLVGKLYPWSRHLYVATAFRKWGLTNGTAAAMILTDRILGKRNPWAKTFRTTRFMPANVVKKLVS